MSEEAIAIGIDLGTTNSCVGVFRNGTVEILRDDNDSNITPSVVSFTDSGRLVGMEAREMELIEDPRNTVYGIKRLIGREFNDPTIQEDLKHWPFTVASVSGKPVVKVQFMRREKTFHPEEISAMVLEKMKSIAEAHLGKPVKDAVITVPAYFDNNQRAATRAAGQIAGLNVLRLMNEPNAAAVAYGLEKRGKRNVLVYDLGGGTFDVSVLSMEGATFKAKSITGNSHLGGEDFDHRMVSHFAKEIQKKLGQDVFTDKRALRRLGRACEKAKIQLSRSTQASFALDSLIKGRSFSSSISRDKFNELNQDLFNSTLETVKRAIEDSRIEKSRIDDVILVGGSTRILKIEEMLKDFFQKQKLSKDINPDEAVAWGAAVQAARLAGNTSHKVRNLTMYDIVPLSLGVSVVGGRMSKIIKRNESIPISRSKSYTTVADGQTSMIVDVYEGERKLIKDNNKIGEFIYEGIPPEPRGYASVDFTFEIDEDCILHVTVRDRDSGIQKSKSMVNNTRRLNEQQLQQLVREAEANRMVDRMKCLRIEAMNELEFYIHDIKSALNNSEFLRWVKPLQKQKVLEEVANVSAWLSSSSGQCASEEQHKKMKDTLGKIWDPISNMVYESKRKATTLKTANKPVLYLGD